jgi:peptidoglycan/LPS O-acetylase OafA/YrhL
LGAWPPLVGHFWSLAVEEQFYLIWPWLILLCPRKILPWTIGCVILLAPAYRFIALRMGLNQLAVFVATPSALDSLGLGALLALCNRRPSLKRIKERLINPVFFAAIACMLLTLVLQKMNLLSTARKVGWYLIVSVIFVCVVDRAAIGMRNPFGRFLELSIIVWIGKISYGIYMYHPLINDLVDHMIAAPPHVSHAYLAGTIAVKGAATLVAATISWYLIEAPLNGLKRYFAY